jgi:hypothetical protein
MVTDKHARIANATVGVFFGVRSGCNRSLTSYFTFGIWLRVCRLANQYDEFSGRMNGIG